DAAIVVRRASRLPPNPRTRRWRLGCAWVCTRSRSCAAVRGESTWHQTSSIVRLGLDARARATQRLNWSKPPGVGLACSSYANCGVTIRYFMSSITPKRQLGEDFSNRETGSDERRSLALHW